MKFKYWLEDTEGRLTHFYLDNSGSLVELSLDYLKPSLLLKGTGNMPKKKIIIALVPSGNKLGWA